MLLNSISNHLSEKLEFILVVNLNEINLLVRIEKARKCKVTTQTCKHTKPHREITFLHTIITLFLTRLTNRDATRSSIQGQYNISIKK